MTLTLATLLAVAIVVGGLAFYFEEQTSSLNAQVSSLDVQVSSLHGRVLALENQTNALKQSGLGLCKGTNSSLAEFREYLGDFLGTLNLQSRTDQQLISELSKERPGNYSAMVLSLTREIGQNGNASFQLGLLIAETQQNNFYFGSDFCSLANKT